MIRSILKGAALMVLGAALLVGYLMRFQGLRIERDGTGIWPILSFYKAEDHMAAIEQNRIATHVDPAPAQVAADAPPVVTFEATKPEQALPKPYWTDFRGPRRDGKYDQFPIATKWPADGPPRLWRKPIGGGYASFVIVQGNAFTIEQRRNQEVVAAYDMASGREIWSHGWEASFQESMGGDGPRATPTWDGGRLYALGAEGELRCLDAASGRRIWSKNILTENGAQNLPWGMAAAPLVVDDKLIVLPGGAAGKSVVAYNKLTGDPIWHALDDKQAYSSPMLVTLAGERQILNVTGHRVVALSTEGKQLWEYPWHTEYEVNASQPVIVDGERILLSAGYGHGAALVRVSKAGDGFTATRVWENTRMKNKFSSSVLHEGHIYGLDEAILACVNVDTGDLKWKGGRYGYGQIVLANGHIIVATEDGDVALVRATPERHEELVRFGAISGKTWNHPAIADRVLLVRNGTEMSAFDIR
jgi:outer membrane protein assembly factor BamB